MLGKATAWTSAVALSLLASSCYLGVDTVPTSKLDAGAIDLDSGNPLANSRTDAGPSEGGAIVMMDAGCSSSLVCPANAPVCSAGACVACKQATDCSRFASTPACAASGACVVCTTEQKSLCSGDAGLCEPTSNQCVQCLSDEQCPSAQAAACGKSDHACGACTSDTQCAHLGKICNTTSGSCVACTPTTEKTDCRSNPSCDPKLAECPGTACDPKAFTCTKQTRNSVESCQACVSDSECVTNYRCIDMVFGSGASPKDQGGHCLKTLSAEAGCLPPYTTTITRETANGVAGGSYCSINEAVSSCAALDALFQAKTCTDAASCGAAGALCKPVKTIPAACSYSCTSSFDCPSYAPCGGPSDGRYCGG